MRCNERPSAAQLVRFDQQARLAAVAQLRDRSLDDDASLVDDRDVVAGLLDLVEKVRGEHDRAAPADERADEAAELQDAGRVEAVHRLVQDQKVRVGDQAAGDPEALAHPE
jgi:hypothetical protein